MKLIFQEDPQEWRKAMLLPAVGVALLSSLLRWRHHLSDAVWRGVLGGAAMVLLLALLRPGWFRGWYRLSQRWGFYSSQFVGRGVLGVFFILVITPVGLGLRWLGKDPLQLKRPASAKSYWQVAKPSSSLEQLF